MSRTLHHRGYNRRRSAKHALSCGCCVDHNWNHANEAREAAADLRTFDEGNPPPLHEDFVSPVNQIAYRESDWFDFLGALDFEDSMEASDEELVDWFTRRASS